MTLPFPTPLHREVAELVCDMFSAHAQVDTVLVVNSCARGKAVPESDLDLAILVDATVPAQELQDLEAVWLECRRTHPLVRKFECWNRFTHVHLDVFDGRFTPTVWDEGGGPDAFEIEIGNRVAYPAPIGKPGPHFADLQSRWLPYYDDDLRWRRLEMVRDACLYDLEHIPFFVSRGLHVQAFDRLYKALQEFLQALMIERRTYPLAYNKWIREQIVDWLHLPDLYRVVTALLSVHDIQSAELIAHAEILRTLAQGLSCR